MTHSSGESLQISYNAAGLIQSMTDSTGRTTTYSYDLRNRLKTKATPIGTLSYDYDYSGNLTKIQSGTTDGALVNYEYDELNRLSRVIDTHGGQNLL